eukprot:gnl/MRDRNA2_/MRDRNA2_101860_c0_seq1.p1 gnl/MRDRNA2_/MRDRNA2_101860_c0~~gnl/MRDRNA2_/MRDRNA2_101860_c0_seq1.p1  ORF type:complete len:358 (+),score=82.92 gnl/MRDRNA2_/MRDRNA2_101860_c0_seq1:55-1128(+)
MRALHPVRSMKCYLPRAPGRPLGFPVRTVVVSLRRPLMPRKRHWSLREFSSSQEQAADGTSKPKEDNGSEAKKKVEKEKTSWFTVFWNVSGGFLGLYIAWHYYKAGYDLNRTELLILEKLRRWPVFPPPGPSQAELNSRCDACGLPPAVYESLCQYFVETDKSSADGVLRDDVVTLIVDLGLGSEEDKWIKSFIAEGSGRLEERKRLSSCSLEETIQLVAECMKLSDKDPETVASQLRIRVPAPMTMAVGESARQAMTMLSETSLPPPQSSTSTVGGFGQTVYQPGASAAPSSPLDDIDEKAAELELLHMEVAGAKKKEAELMVLLENRGTLTEAEMARLNQVRRLRADLEAELAKL